MKLPDISPQKLKFIIAGVLIVLTTSIIAVAGFQTKEEKIATIPSKSYGPTSTPQPTSKKQSPTPTPTISYPTWTPTPIPQKPTATLIPVPTNTPAPTATTGPTATPTPPPDTQPPQSRVLSPKNGGELLYKTDGRICAISEGPLDNVSNWQKIQTRYKFDGDDWTSYETMRVYFCRDPLPNGQHTLTVQSKDEAGNTEAEQTLSFMVNIAEN